MTWKLPADTDEKVREWMKSRGWPVTSTDFHHERQVYSWRHQDGRRAVTLRITKQVLDQYPWFALLEHFERLKLAVTFRQTMQADRVLVQRGQTVQLEEW